MQTSTGDTGLRARKRECTFGDVLDIAFVTKASAAVSDAREGSMGAAYCVNFHVVGLPSASTIVPDHKSATDRREKRGAAKPCRGRYG